MATPDWISELPVSVTRTANASGPYWLALSLWLIVGGLLLGEVLSIRPAEAQLRSGELIVRNEQRIELETLEALINRKEGARRFAYADVLTRYLDRITGISLDGPVFEVAASLPAA